VSHASTSHSSRASSAHVPAGDDQCAACHSTARRIAHCGRPRSGQAVRPCGPWLSHLFLRSK
jgi:hypothetical protein